MWHVNEMFGEHLIPVCQEPVFLSDSDAERESKDEATDEATMQMVMGERNFVHPDATQPCMH